MVREETGFKAMEEYIGRRQNTVSQLIATQLILDLCEDMERMSEVRVGMRWWEQAVIDLTGARDRAAAADADEDGGEQ